MTQADAPTAKPKAKARRRKRADGRRTAWLFRFDQNFGARFVAGADEAGRGCLAGPLVAAGVLLDYAKLGPEERKLLAYRYEGFWQAMDTFKDRQALEERHRVGDTPWRVWDRAAPPPRASSGHRG